MSAVRRTQLKVLIAPDTFKGSLASPGVCHAIQRGLQRYAAATTGNLHHASSQSIPQLDIRLCPVSDGGAGLLDAVCTAAPHLQRVTIGAATTSLPSHDEQTTSTASSSWSSTLPILGPLGQRLPQGADIAISFDRREIIVEMAQAAGLSLVPESQRNPLHTTSFGVGQLLAAALRIVVESSTSHVTSITPPPSEGAWTLYVGIGGSSTNDAGLAALQALGMRIYLQRRSSLVAGITAQPPGEHHSEGDGEILLDRPLVGGDLKNISRLETSPELETFRNVFNNGRLVLICDVDNPLLGPRGATYIYGPQKGATTSAILEDLEMGMANAAKHIDAISLLTSVTSTSSSVATMVGAGGAGGMSGAFAHALGAQWKCGADVVADMVDLPRLVSDADVVITGEGSFDSQTLHHRKTVAKLAELVAATNREDGKQRSVSVVCGRTDVIVQVGQEELNVVGTTTTCDDDDEDERMVRKVIQCVVPISSDRGGPFDSAEAMRNTAFCIEEVVAERAAHILSLAQQPLL